MGKIMLKVATPPPPLLLLVLLFTVASSFNVSLGSKEIGRKLAEESPFTAKASFIRYWKKQVSTNLPKSFFLDKASPLDAVQLATFSKLADQNSLSIRLPTFCKQADLFCFPDVGTSLEKHSQDVNFAEYNLQNFTNYGTNRLGGVDSFKNYTNDDNLPVDTFRRYSRDSVGHDDMFTNYALDSNVVDQTFNTYGTKATGGTGKFSNYNDDTNIPGLTFTSYSDSTNGRTQDFKTYSQNANVGDQTFTSYGKNGNAATNEFTSYGNQSNVMTSSFSNYGETGNGESDNFTSYAANGNVPTNTFKTYARDGNGETQTFTSYGSNGNVPTNNFTSYGSGGNGITQNFANYRDQSNVGDDSFQSYAQGSNSQALGFTNYGQSFNEGSDTFKGYAKDSTGETTVDFKTYGVNNTFKDYAKTGVTFSDYRNGTDSPLAAMATSAAKKMNSRWVEPGKFFREKMLQTGTVMPMPDIRDKMPKRSFLPRRILSKLPFSTSKIDELKKIFHAADDSSMTRMMTNTLSECERAPSPGETKRCVGSAEDMVDFATSVLGRNVVVRSTENTQGSGKDIMIGTVTGINGGQVTKSVSCHQSLYPYLVYYCHSVPKVRVYEADILDPNSKAKLNHGVAICHVDTSSWSQTHGAFLALGSGPGKIEVCHWIYENDMTWTTSD
ncbi:OLC1v1028283C1 [Oldenlandia corymbosa var. corymbosa]|uniref:OLC1v1028283C1 n=1 Tax=Oldenlandia corymbosa var. corymbosa TaxID=529605 RepID=A0AAV1CC37_OLDCO|nr:OLC1v1028283C1 [Oldenlandia corymbosa var. corymbosa]